VALQKVLDLSFVHFVTLLEGCASKSFMSGYDVRTAVSYDVRTAVSYDV
jgi:hypothetical protein